MSKLVSQQLVSVIKSQLLDYIIDPHTQFIVGVSGGKDSMALLHLLNSQFKNVKAIHVNYGLRAADSDADQNLVEEYCRSYNIELKTVKAPEFNEGNFQQNARDFRYKCFNELAKTHANQPFLICTGHHENDQIETILHRIYEGKSPLIYGGMKVITGKMYKPLLTTSLATIEAYVNENNIPWRLDKSNLESKYKRNFLRNNIIPKLKNNYNKFNDSILKQVEYSNTYADIIEQVKSTIQIAQHSLDLSKWTKLKPNIQFAVLTYWFHIDLGLHHISDKSVQEIATQLNKGVENGWEYTINGVNDTEEWVLNISQSILFAFNNKLYQNYKPTTLKAPAKLTESKCLFDDFFLQFELNSNEFDTSVNNKIWFKSFLNNPDISFRSVHVGDRFKPIGLKGKSKKVYDILSELGIPSYIRKYAILIFSATKAVALIFPQLDISLPKIKNIGMVSIYGKLDDMTESSFSITKNSKNGHL